jgi:hypothetical protein
MEGGFVADGELVESRSDGAVARAVTIRCHTPARCQRRNREYTACQEP